MSDTGRAIRNAKGMRILHRFALQMQLLYARRHYKRTLSAKQMFIEQITIIRFFLDARMHYGRSLINRAVALTSIGFNSIC